MKHFSQFVILLASPAILLFSMSTLAEQKPSSPHEPISAPASTTHLRLGKEAGSKGSWKEAEKQFRIYRNQNRDSANAIVLHAESLIKINQPFDAALELQEFLQQHPDALRAHELYAVLAATVLKDSTLAAGELEICVKLDPRDFQAWESLGDLYFDKAIPEKSIVAYRNAARLRPQDPIAVASLAHAYAQNGNSADAMTEFRRALKAIKSQPEGSKISVKYAAAVQFLYGKYLVEQGREGEAVAALDAALRYNPRSADAQYWRARAYDKLNDPRDAEAAALAAVQATPHGKEAPLFLISFYRKQGKPEKAQEYADLAQKISDEEQQAASFGRSLRDALDKAEPLLREGRFSEAAVQYEALLKLLPTFYEAYFDLGMCYSQTGLLHDAETALRKYLSFQPVSADGRAALGILLLEQARGPEAITELKQAIQIDPTLDEARKALATEYLAESNPKAAIATLRGAKDRRDAPLMALLAKALDADGEHAAAVQAINRALIVGPNDPETLKIEQTILSNASAKEE